MQGARQVGGFRQFTNSKSTASIYIQVQEKRFPPIRTVNQTEFLSGRGVFPFMFLVCSVSPSLWKLALSVQNCPSMLSIFSRIFLIG